MADKAEQERRDGGNPRLPGTRHLNKANAKHRCRRGKSRARIPLRREMALHSSTPGKRLKPEGIEAPGK